jgi:asparagine synthase (glutamine-hydrolysing)
MCGIAGAIGDDGPRTVARVEAMLAALAHRGPDGSGLVVADGAVLGHRRLALVDLSERGAQPFVDPRTGRVAVVNGQFYDHVELRARLSAEGATFRGLSDSELLLPLFEREGVDVVANLRGPFAFAIYDPKGRRALLARDRFGKRPLHYAHLDGVLWFSSEPAALARALGLKPRRDVLPAFFRLGYPRPPFAPFERMVALGPSERLAFAAGDTEPRVDRTWTPRAPAPFAAEEPTAIVERLDALLLDATARRLACDRKVGVLLSGGTDSAATLLAAVRSNEGGPPLKAFVGAFDDRAFDESSAAARTARALGVDLKIARCDVGVEDRLRRFVATTGDLLSDASFLALAATFETARGEATTLLTGDGADEAWIGYERHRVAAFGGFALTLAGAFGRARFLRRSPRLAKAAAAARATSPRARYAELVAAATTDALAERLSPEVLRGDPALDLFDALKAEADVDVLADVARLDLATYLPFDLMTKADRAAGLSGLDVRAPFLDPPIVDFALSLSGAARATRRRGKTPIRALLARRGLGFVAARKKKGFGVPLRKWLVDGPLAKLARDALNDVREPFRGVLRGDSAAPHLEDLRRGAPIAPFVYACLVAALHHDAFT